MSKRLLTAALLLAGTVTPLLTLADVPTASAVTCTVTVRLTPGMSHPAVRCLEQRLRELKYSVGTPDALYSTASVNAVKSFQRTRGLYSDGIVTSITGRQLGLRGALPAATAPRVTVLGDSTSAAMRWYDEARNETAIYDIMGTTYDLKWSVESCRRLVAASCIGRTDPGTGLKWQPVSVLPEMRGALKGRLGDAVVIMAGYDDYPSLAGAIDSIVGEAEQQSVARVFWLTYRTTSSYGYGGYYRQHNAALAAAKVRHPNLVVLDWNNYTHRQTAATQQAWFEADGIHMTRSGGVALAKYLKAAIDASTVRACTGAVARTGAASGPVGVPAAPATGANGLVPIAPMRMFDSRTTTTGKVGAGRTIDIDLSAVVPADASNVALGVTAIGPCGRGYLTVYACGVRPGTSTLNYEGGRSTSVGAISTTTDRHVCIYASTATDVVVELNGWFAPAGDAFHPIDVRRWLDTRTGNGAVVPTVGQLAPNARITVPIAGRGGVPAGATAAWLNVTGVASTAPGALRVSPGPCAAAPATVTTQVFTGRAAASSMLAKLGADGSICLTATSGALHAVLDVSGWFGAGPAGLAYQAVVPSRLVDTRGRTAPAAGSVIRVPRSGVSVLNIVSVAASDLGYVSAKPCGVVAVSSLLNTARGENVANLAAVRPGGGSVCISPSIASHLVVDVTGQFVAVG